MAHYLKFEDESGIPTIDLTTLAEQNNKVELHDLLCKPLKDAIEYCGDVNIVEGVAIVNGELKNVEASNAPMMDCFLMEYNTQMPELADTLRKTAMDYEELRIRFYGKVALSYSKTGYKVFDWLDEINEGAGAVFFKPVLDDGHLEAELEPGASEEVSKQSVVGEALRKADEVVEAAISPTLETIRKAKHRPGHSESLKDQGVNADIVIEGLERILTESRVIKLEDICNELAMSDKYQELCAELRDVIENKRSYVVFPGLVFRNGELVPLDRHVICDGEVIADYQFRSSEVLTKYLQVEIDKLTRKDSDTFTLYLTDFISLTIEEHFVLSVDINMDLAVPVKPLKDRRQVIAARITRDGKFFMMHHNKTGCISVPCGKVDEGESPELALYRELNEELGIEVVIIKKCMMLYNPKIDAMQFIYDVEFRGEPKNLEPEKHDWVDWMTMSEINDHPKSLTEVSISALDLI